MKFLILALILLSPSILRANQSTMYCNLSKSCFADSPCSTQSDTLIFDLASTENAGIWATISPLKPPVHVQVSNGAYFWADSQGAYFATIESAQNLVFVETPFNGASIVSFGTCNQVIS